MKNFYIVTNNDYLNSLYERDRIHRERNAFVKKFFLEKGIDGSEYILHGRGSVGQPFLERSKSDIGLCVEDTENNYSQFEHDGKLYLSISNNDVDTITPMVDGFNEIKGSEFYKAKEEYEI